MSLVLPPPSPIPTGSSVVDLLQRVNGKSLMTVPSILEDIANTEGTKDVVPLVDLNFLAFGGGLLKKSVGDKLLASGVKLLNHYGATEIGPIAPIFTPPNDYDYHYFRIRKDMDLEISELPASSDGRPRYRLTALPFGWTTKMVVQDELISNPLHPHSDFSAIGRNDDMIVLATGQKVIPHVLESSLSESNDIKAAAAFGDGQFELGVIVEPQDPVVADDRQRFVSSIWSLIIDTNTRTDGDAQISAPAAVVIVAPEKPLPRSDKGSIMRKEVYKIYEEEISQVYRDLEDSAMDQSVISLNIDNLEQELKDLVQNGLSWKVEPGSWGCHDDFFELGMDSLQAVKLRRLLLSSTAITPANHLCRERDFVYRHPTVSQLASALRGTTTDTPGSQIASFVAQYSLVPQLEKPNVILLTGSTGGLGANVLMHIASSPEISKIVCILRPRSGLNPSDRQIHALRAQGINVDASLLGKLEIIQTNTTMPCLGLDDADYQRVEKQVTHILHAAWPTDFKMMLPSFKGQFETIRNLLGLALDASRFAVSRPRLLFVSSVASVGQYKSVYGRSRIPEAPIADDRCTNTFGYGEAKLVCEHIIENARSTHGSIIDVFLVRVGQITGSTITSHWNPAEHIPAMLKSSQYIGALPDINGVSQIKLHLAAPSLTKL